MGEGKKMKKKHSGAFEIGIQRKQRIRVIFNGISPITNKCGEKY